MGNPSPALPHASARLLSDAFDDLLVVLNQRLPAAQRATNRRSCRVADAWSQCLAELRLLCRSLLDSIPLTRGRPVDLNRFSLDVPCKLWEEALSLSQLPSRRGNVRNPLPDWDAFHSNPEVWATQLGFQPPVTALALLSSGHPPSQSPTPVTWDSLPDRACAAPHASGQQSNPALHPAAAEALYTDTLVCEDAARHRLPLQLPLIDALQQGRGIPDSVRRLHQSLFSEAKVRLDTREASLLPSLSPETCLRPLYPRQSSHEQLRTLSSAWTFCSSAGRRIVASGYVDDVEHYLPLLSGILEFFFSKMEDLLKKYLFTPKKLFSFLVCSLTSNFHHHG